MNGRLTLGLLLCLALLGGYVYFFEWSPDDETAGPTPVYGTLYGEYDLVALEVAGATETLSFARTDDTLTQDWQMVNPRPIAPNELDQVRVNGATTRLGRLTTSQVITNVTNLAEYGLAPPRLTVTLTLSDAQQIILYAGDETPVQNNRYFRLASQPQTVYLTGAFAFDALQQFFDQPPLVPTPLPTPTPSPAP